jgi:hypothetical protein
MRTTFVCNRASCYRPVDTELCHIMYEAENNKALAFMIPPFGCSRRNVSEELIGRSVSVFRNNWTVGPIVGTHCCSTIRPKGPHYCLTIVPRVAEHNDLR